jgi:hypothetical protein
MTVGGMRLCTSWIEYGVRRKVMVLPQQEEEQEQEQQGFYILIR